MNKQTKLLKATNFEKEGVYKSLKMKEKSKFQLLPVDESER